MWIRAVQMEDVINMYSYVDHCFLKEALGSYMLPIY